MTWDRKLKRPPERKMPAARVLKPKPVEASGKTLERSRPVQVRAVTGARAELQPPAVRKSRASSCPRCPPPRGRCERDTGAQRAALRASCERRTRSSSTAPKTTTCTSTWPRTNPDCRTAVKHAAVGPKCRETSAGPGQRDQRSVRTESKHTSHRWDRRDHQEVLRCPSVKYNYSNDKLYL